jgi:hypothetical protein
LFAFDFSLLPCLSVYIFLLFVFSSEFPSSIFCFFSLFLCFSLSLLLLLFYIPPPCASIKVVKTSRNGKTGWGSNIETINIDNRKWLTSTSFWSQRNINIEKVLGRSSRFFFFFFLGGGPGGAWPNGYVIFCRIWKWKKMGITLNAITYEGLRWLHKKEIFSRNNVNNISQLKTVT